MANRYWVGGSGIWDNSSTTHWSATSGGTAGASAPTALDNAIIDANSGAGATITVASTAVAANASVDKSDLILSLSGNATLVGSAYVFTLTSGTVQLNSYTLTIGRFSSSNSNVRTIAFGTGNITLTGSNTTIWVTTNLSGFAVTGTPTVNATYSGSTGSRTITGGSVIATSEANSINFNISAGSDTVVISNAIYKNLSFTGFSGAITANSLVVYGNLTIPATVTSITGTRIRFSASSGTQTVLTNGITIGSTSVQVNGGGTVVFNDALTATGTEFAFTLGTIKFKAGVTTTLPSFVTSGTTQKYLQSTTAGSQATLSQASGTVTVSYLSIKDIAATGGATWNAYVDYNNVDQGDNTGWDFSYSPAIDNEFPVALRSFTQPKRF